MGIPRIIHKIWHDFSKDGSGRAIPEKYMINQNKCQQINKEFTTLVWDAEKCRELLETKFPWFLPVYDEYTYDIQRVDAIRPFILYEYGGIYLDMDVECIKPFGSVIQENSDKIFIVEDVNKILSYSFNNFIIASPPKHRFWETVMDQLVKNRTKKSLFSKSLTVLNSTGPGLLEVSYSFYVRLGPDREKEFVILPKEKFNPCDICGKRYDDDPYIIHKSKASWSNRSERFYGSILCSKAFVITASIFFVILVVLLILFIRYVTRNKIG